MLNESCMARNSPTIAIRFQRTPGSSKVRFLANISRIFSSGAISNENDCNVSIISIAVSLYVSGMAGSFGGGGSISTSIFVYVELGFQICILFYYYLLLGDVYVAHLFETIAFVGVLSERQISNVVRAFFDISHLKINPLLWGFLINHCPI